MKVFNKYLVTGKDIIIIDNRKYVFNPEESDLINKLYVNKFWIGADKISSANA